MPSSRLSTWAIVFSLNNFLCVSVLWLLPLRIGFMATSLMAANQGTDAMAAHQVSMNLMGLTISIILVFVYLLGGKALFGLFFPEEPHIVKICVNISYVIIITILFQISQVIYMGCLRGAGDTKYTAIYSMLSVTVIRTIFSFACCYIFHWGIIGIWMGVLADQVSRYGFASVRFKQGRWVNIKI